MDSSENYEGPTDFDENLRLGIQEELYEKYDEIQKTPLWGELWEYPWDRITVQAVKAYLEDPEIDRTRFLDQLSDLLSSAISLLGTDQFNVPLPCMKTSTCLINPDLFLFLIDIEEYMELYLIYITVTENQEIKNRVTDFLHTTSELFDVCQAIRTGRINFKIVRDSGVIFPYKLIPMLQLYKKTSFKIFKYFLEDGTDINSQSPECIRQTMSDAIVNILCYMMLSAKKRDLLFETVTLLVSKGANINQPEILVRCFQYNLNDVLKFLIEAGLDLKSCSTVPAFKKTLLYADFDMFKYCLENGMTLTISDEEKTQNRSVDEKIQFAMNNGIDPLDLARCFCYSE